MKRLMTAVALVGLFGLAACEDYDTDRAEAPPPVELPEAPAAEDVAVPAAETEAPIDAPVDAPLPPEERASEETVQPESETLFY